MAHGTMKIEVDLSAAARDELRDLTDRLAAAEKVCILYALSPSHANGSDIEKAAYMAWCLWRDLVPAGMFERTLGLREEVRRLVELRRQALAARP
jgi:hypothetical protein